MDASLCRSFNSNRVDTRESDFNVLGTQTLNLNSSTFQTITANNNNNYSIINILQC